MRALKKSSLQRLFLTLSLAQIIVTAMAVGLVSYHGSRRVYNRSLDKIQEIQLEQTLDNIHFYLHSATKYTEITASLIEEKRLDPEDTEAMLGYLWEMGGHFPNLGTLGWADEEGRFIGINRREGYITLTRRTDGRQNLLRWTAAPPALHISLGTEPLKRVPDYDPRRREWYRKAAAAGGTAWMEADFSVSSRRLDVTAVTPVYNNRKQLRGVAMTDISLNHLSQELQRLSSFKTGHTVILDGEGQVIASSMIVAPYLRNAQGEMQRMNLSNAPMPEILELGHLEELSPETRQPLPPARSLKAKLSHSGRSRIMTAPLPHSSHFTCDPPAWLTVVVLPEHYYQEPLQGVLVQTLMLTLMITLLSTLMTLVLIRRILLPLRQLTDFVHALTQGRWLKAPTSNRQDEIGQLTRSFVTMTLQIRETLADLRRENRERRRIQEDLKHSLEEKEILLKEIHHRVKNNMQIINSLMSLEREGLPQEDDSINHLLDDLTGRINAMALVHEKLYQSEELSRIALDEFIPDLVAGMSSIFGSTFMKVHTHYHLPDWEITIEQAIPMGLLINEVVSNSIKHAFAGRHEGTLSFSGAILEGGSKHGRGSQSPVLRLELQDDGTGFDPETARRQGSLGMVLIDSLQKQLKADLTIESSPAGTRFILDIPR